MAGFRSAGHNLLIYARNNFVKSFKIHNSSDHDCNGQLLDEEHNSRCI